MSMYNDIDWTKRRNRENCIVSTIKDSREDFVHSWCLDRRRNGTELMSTKLDGECVKTVEDMMLTNDGNTEYHDPLSEWWRSSHHRPDSQQGPVFWTARLVLLSDKWAFQSSDISSQVSLSISSRISLYCHSFTDADTQRKITTSLAVHHSAAKVMIPSIFVTWTLGNCVKVVLHPPLWSNIFWVSSG